MLPRASPLSSRSANPCSRGNEPMPNRDDKVVITCALTGVLANREQCPWVPYTPEEIADEAKRAYDAGATVVHIHARDPESGGPSYEPDVYAAIAREIRKRCPIILNF